MQKSLGSHLKGAAAALGAIKALAAPMQGELLKSSILPMQTNVALAPKKGRLFISWQMFFKAFQQSCNRLEKQRV